MRGWAAALALLAAGGARAQAQDPDPWLGPDKAVHFGVSAGIAGGGYALAGLWRPSSEAQRLVVGGSADRNIGRMTSRTSKRILIVAANPSVSKTTGWPIGFWWAELTHPYWTFTQAGYEVEIRSPDGGALTADGYSDPEDQSGYSAHDLLSLGFKKSPKHMGLIQDTRPLEDINVAAYDAVFVIGGQSPMFTFRGNKKVQDVVQRFYEAGKVTALVCHGTCVLLETKLSTGELLVKGKTWTGFANSEEQYADAYVGKRIQPFWIEDEARKIEGTNFVVEQRFREFAVRDGLLVTGQQQHSGSAAAKLVIEALGR